MLRNFFVIAYRNLIRNKVFSTINIVGLAIGMAACTLILLFIQYELSFEDMHPDAENIYRVLTIDKALGTNNQRVGITMPPLGPALPEAFPEVDASLRLTGAQQTLLISDEPPGIFADAVRYSDPGFFQFFGFKLVDGDPETALAEPYNIVLSESLAKRLFGGNDAFGQTIKTGDGENLLITGIMEDLPGNTHLELDAVGSIKTLESSAYANRPPDATRPIWLETWQMIAMPTYVSFKPGTDISGFDAKITELTRGNDVGENFDITLQPLAYVHLHSVDVIFDPIANKGDIKNIYTFADIALLILILASVNYMNLSTARSMKRAREVGLRKVVGSKHSQLIFQFLSESVLITFIAFLLSGVFTQLSLPWLNGLSNTALTFNLFGNGTLLISSLVMLLLVGILAGLYPAFILAGFKPITVLVGRLHSGNKGNFLRKALVVGQFALSISLISLAMIIQKQIHYIQEKDMGYEREQVLLLDIFDLSMADGFLHLTEELRNHSAFRSSALSSNVPGRTFGRTGIKPEGTSDDDIWIWSQFAVSPETIPALGMEITAGRNFSSERSDSTGVALINETAAKQLGWDDPVNKRLYFGAQDSTGVEVVGVVKDFNYIGIHQKIEPVVIFPLPPDRGNVISAGILPGRIKEALAFAEERWNSHFPDHPFVYQFMDDEFDALYSRDMNTGKIVNAFSLLAIFVACLGLFGLASHSTTMRIKEIGIRKTLGATTSGIIRLLVMDFIKWVILSNLIAWPLAWYFSQNWLAGFAYQIKVTAAPLLLASLAAIVIAILTVVSQSWRAALLNPVKAIRYE